jgi:hypothetical protein
MRLDLKDLTPERLEELKKTGYDYIEVCHNHDVLVHVTEYDLLVDHPLYEDYMLSDDEDRNTYNKMIDDARQYMKEYEYNPENGDLGGYYEAFTDWVEGGRQD